MPRRLLATTALPILALLAATACEGGRTPSPGATLRTVVDPTQARAGQPVSARCEVLGVRAQDAGWTPTLAVEPLVGIILDGGTATPTTVGKYTFTCRADGIGPADGDPVILTVVAADPAATVATVEPSTIPAGTTTTATCNVYDAFGNPIPEATGTIDPVDGLTIDGMVIGSAKAGAYTIGCSVEGFEVTQTTARLLVRPVDPATSVATVDPSTIPAGGSATATCAVYDAFGNPVPDATTSIDPVEGLTINDTTIGSTKSGTYDIGCSVEGFEVTRTTAPLVVTPLDPASSVATVDPATIPAGGSATATCAVYDTFGNAVTDRPPTLDPVEGLTIDDMTIGSTKAGTYEIGCSVEGFEVTQTTAQLVVTPVDPVSTVVTVDPATVPAGTSATATCTAYDASGNPVPGAKTSFDPVAGLTIEGQAVGSTKVGTYEIGCSVEGFEVTRTTARLGVVPADPARLEIAAQPDWPVYAIDDTTTVSWKVFDAYDNEITGLPATATPPPGMAALGNSRFRFTDEGHFLLRVALNAPWQAVEGSRMFVCDVGAPTIEIEFPPRGHTQDGDPTLVVRGKVLDGAGSGIGSLRINGAAATVNEDGSFEFPVTGSHGLNVLLLVARDEFDHETFTTRGWYYSTKWLKVDAATTLDDTILPESVLLHLGQAFLDDGDHDPAHPNDLATLVELLLGNAIEPLLADLPPFNFPIPNAINVKIAGIGLEGDLEVGVTVKDVTLGTPRVALDLMDGGISASLSFQPVSLGLELTFVIHARATGFGQTIPLLDPSTTSTGSLSIGTLGVTLALDIVKPLGGDLSVAGRDFQLTLTDVDISPIESLKIHLGRIPNTGIDLGDVDLSWLVGGINDLLSRYVLNPLINLVTQPLIDLLEPLVVGVIGDAMQQVLGLLNLRQTFPLPGLLGGPSVDLGVALSMSSVLFTEEAGRIGMDLGFSATKAIPREPPKGTILRDGCDQTEEIAPQFIFPAEPSVQAGLTHDTVNELLFMVWWGGMLQGTFDASSLAGGAGGGLVDNILLTPTLWLPPILNDCGDMSQRIEIGDLFLEVQLDLLGNTQWLEAWIQASAEVEIIAVGDEVGMRIGKIQKLEYEIYDVGGGLGDLLDMVTGMLPDLLKGIEGQQFTFPIPSIPLDGLLPGIPAGTTLQLGDLAASVDTGVVRVGGNLK